MDKYELRQSSKNPACAGCLPESLRRPCVEYSGCDKVKSQMLSEETLCIGALI